MEDGNQMNKLNILYEDNHIIVVEKPCNVLSQSDATNDLDLLTMVKQYIKEKYHKPGNVYIGLVHRLDRPVGGIMVFARSSKAAARLTKQIQNHEFQKKYLAVARGKMEQDCATYKDFILKLEDGNSIISSKGKVAILNYQLLEYNKEEDMSLVSIDLKTGRHHQIRVQFANHNHPLCGDQRYGKEVDKTQIALYAYSLSFTHPTTKEILHFELKPKKVGYWTKFTK